jgi:membrane protease subunit HflK
MPPAPSPWHHSRPRRAARPPRRGATAPGTLAAFDLVRRLGGARLPRLPKRGVLVLGSAAVLAMVGATSLHPVGPHDQAIVATLGAWGPVHGPGLAVSWPWPIGTVHIEDVATMRRLALPDGAGEHLMLTRDGGLIDVAYDVRWRIRDLRRHALGLANPDATLRLVADTAMRATLAGLNFPAAMGADRDGMGHAAARRAQALLDGYQAGIAIDGIDIRRADPPLRVAEAMRAVLAARTDAAGEADQARSWSRQWVTHAQGEADAFDQIYAQYRKAPDITRRQMYYATMERVLAQSDKVIVDAPGTTMVLPPLTPPAADPAPRGTKAGDGH